MPEVPPPIEVERLSIGPGKVAWLDRYEMRPISGTIPTRWRSPLRTARCAPC
jgi:hypothetical protein